MAYLLCSFIAMSTTETAVANGDTRTLHLYHTHTGESIDATFRVDGHYDPAVLRQLNHFLRDWRNNDEINMDPRLFDTLWEVYRTAGATQPIQVYSAYRSPETNAMLRRRSRAVAQHSQHMLGKAMDTTIPGFPMHLIREVGMKLQRGGVGWYPSANFVHLDVGGVRSWPRMSYEQLATLFPDGKTVHIASNGQVLPGYEAARAEIAARGGTEVPPAQESQGFFAWLFGSGSSNSAAHEDEEERTTAVAAAAPPLGRQPAPGMQEAMAYAGRDPAPTVAQAQAEPSAVEPQQQVASLEPSAAPADSALALPLPPRRPSDLAAVQVPLPPIRPAGLTPPRSGSVHFADVTPPRRPEAFLPSIITQGARDRLPNNALAFADGLQSERLAALRAVPMPIARPVLARSIGLRAAQHESRKQTASATAWEADTPIVAGPQLTGLRRAHQILSKNAAL